MDYVQQCHDIILAQRASIRNHKSILDWITKCWVIIPRVDPQTISFQEYGDFYTTILNEMTIEWEEELNATIVTTMWARDTHPHTDLNFDRFACSFFYFVEMWVDEITFSCYLKTFKHIHGIIARALSVSKASSKHNQLKISKKPTLCTFKAAFDHEQMLEREDMHLGKSIFFNAGLYFHHFGLPPDGLTDHIGARQYRKFSKNNKYGQESVVNSSTPKSSPSSPTTSSHGMRSHGAVIRIPNPEILGQQECRTFWRQKRDKKSEELHAAKLNRGLLNISLGCNAVENSTDKMQEYTQPYSNSLPISSPSALFWRFQEKNATMLTNNLQEPTSECRGKSNKIQMEIPSPPISPLISHHPDKLGTKWTLRGHPVNTSSVQRNVRVHKVSPTQKLAL